MPELLIKYFFGFCKFKTMATVQESSRLGGLVTKFDSLNKSTAKVTYSFGKGQRFPSVRRPAT